MRLDLRNRLVQELALLYVLASLVIHLPDAAFVFLRNAQLVAGVGQHLLEFQRLFLGGLRPRPGRAFDLALKALAQLLHPVCRPVAATDQRLEFAIESFVGLLRGLRELRARIVQCLLEIRELVRHVQYPPVLSDWPGLIQVRVLTGNIVQSTNAHHRRPDPCYVFGRRLE